MDIPTLKTTAADHLSAAPYSPKKLSALHSGVALAASLLLTLMNLLLTRQIDGTGGLSGITTRAVLSFAQTMLLIGVTLAMPFWEFGFYKAALNLSRREPATPATLLDGFRRFGVILRLTLLRTALVVGVTLACLQLASILFMLSPWSALTMQTAEALLASGAALDDAAIMQMMETMYPVYILLAVLLCVLLIPIVYRFRLADFAVLDDTPKALRAMALSSYWMHKKRMWLFRLDLGFWWYYGLHALAALMAYGDLLLPILGISLDPDTALLLFSVLSGCVQFMVTWRFAPLVQTTYALAYSHLRSEKPPLGQTPPSRPKTSPWEN